eukprot:TRINITY_DN6130_c0_g1_i4.p1 TRINITY_DN6130_c0_g1~~TRINITY_DN6130_c0_g1_i4.p1  ORF type:complete len:739 (+),score=174.88 TRINITY_DN6130_c0_g1_i4:2055-4271(+)
MKDTVQCKRCGYESCRNDKFLDIPLVIKGFGQTKAVASIEEALSKFIEPEILAGDNQYACDKCKMKVDAIKGLKFSKFPYLLTLQLKRFDYDFVMDRRIKLNDRVSFPDILDMNQYLEDQRMNDAPPTSSEMSYNDRLNEAIKNGPYVYELFSVLIHKGSAIGGHYYAYIKSFRNGNWYSFNDSSVTEIRDDAYKTTFGESESNERRGFFLSSGTNAYMLMYRQYDPSRNMLEPSKDDIPEQLKQAIEEDSLADKQKEQEKELKRNMVHIKLFYQEQLRELDIHKEEKVSSLLAKCAESFDLSSFLPHNIRVREYLPYYEIPGKVLNDMEQTIEDLRWYFHQQLVLETKLSNEEFEEYQHLHLTLRVSVLDSVTSQWSPVHYLSIDKKSTIGDLKSKLSSRFNLPKDRMVIVSEEPGQKLGSIIPMDDDSKGIRGDTVHLIEGTKIFVEDLVEEGSKPKSFGHILNLRNTIEILFNEPGSTQFNKKVSILRTNTLLDLKLKIKEVINLELDEFKVLRGGVGFASELKNEDDKISDYKFSSSQRLMIEKGKPMRHGEINIKFFYSDLNGEMEELFELPIPGKMTVKEAKAEVIKHFKTVDATKYKNKITMNDPDNIRFRRFYTLKSRVYLDTEIIKDIAVFIFSNEIIVQKLPDGEVETKTTKDHIVLGLQQFHPDKYTVGPKFELTTHEDETLSEFRERLTKVTGIGNTLVLAEVDTREGLRLLNVPKLRWLKAYDSV